MYTQDLTLADYFLTFHKIISRGVDIPSDRIDLFNQEDYPDEQTREGYLNYVEALAVLLDSHHKTEDDIAFPYFQDTLPDTHFIWLHQDHDLITGFLEEGAPILDHLKNSEQVKQNFGMLKQVLLKIEDRWSQHIELEEEEFVEIIDALSTNEERSQLFTQFGDYNQELLNPHQLTIPFMLYNLEPQDRIIIINTHPNDWFIHIDNSEWETKWQSMKPFLLSEFQ
jgi:hypothetical protein